VTAEFARTSSADAIHDTLSEVMLLSNEVVGAVELPMKKAVNSHVDKIKNVVTFNKCKTKSYTEKLEKCKCSNLI